jgi:hypothetical protein
MSPRERALYHGWVAVSYLLICGWLLAFGALGALYGLETRWVLHGVVILGSFAGGFTAARVAPRPRTLEPATAGVAVVATVIAAVVTDLGGLAAVGADARLFFEHAAFGAEALAMSWLGARLAIRTTTTPAADTALRAAAVSLLIYLGIFFASWLVVAIAVPGVFDGADDAPGLVAAALLILGLSAALAGLVTQLITPSRRLGACAAGAPLGLAFLACFAVADDAEAALGLLVLGFLTWGVGVAVAGLGWKLRDRPRGPALPPAEILD